jgi:hypothetical protein
VNVILAKRECCVNLHVQNCSVACVFVLDALVEVPHFGKNFLCCSVPVEVYVSFVAWYVLTICLLCFMSCVCNELNLLITVSCLGLNIGQKRLHVDIVQHCAATTHEWKCWR